MKPDRPSKHEPHETCAPTKKAKSKPYLVVKVLDRLPLDALVHILLLLLLQRQLNEDLLQALVHKVDAELARVRAGGNEK